jgi:RNA polymerase sigma-70 factor (ECF subfamily)
MLASMNYFLASEWERIRSQKRGGAQPILSLDLAAAEQRFDLEPASTASPDKLFDRQWAIALLDKVLNQIEEENRREGKAELFEALKQTLTGSRESQPYAELASRLGISEGAIKVAVHRLRRRYRELVHAEISQTVASPKDADEEMKHLFQALTS